MSARDELAKLLFMADNSAAENPEAEWREVQKFYPHGTVYAYNLADAMLADGYAKSPKPKGDSPYGLIRELFKHVRAWEADGHTTVGIDFLRRHFREAKP